MLNCCIEHKKKREQLHKGYTGETYYSGSDFGPSTSRISRTFSDEGEEEGEGEGVSQGENEPVSEGLTEGATKTMVSSSDDDDDDEFFECDDDNDEKNQLAEKKSENLTEEKEVDESLVNQSGNEAQSANDSENQTGAVGHLSDNQTTEETGSVENIPSNADVDNSCDNQSRDSQIPLADNRHVTGTSNIDQSQTASSPVNLSETVISSVSSPRDSLSNMSVQSDSAFLETFTHNPEGRLAPYQDLYLVNCAERMYIPITQEPAPMTEDMLEEHAEVLAK